MILRVFAVAASLLLIAPELLASDEVKEVAPETGTRIRQQVATGTGPYPLNKRFDRFTPEELARFKSLYADMGDNDEPPFPVSGFGPIIQELSGLAGRVRYVGEFTVHIIVSADGKATGVELVKVADSNGARALAGAFLRADYKPAKCAGVQCEMKLPFSATFR
jgi:hypothetical protein